MFRHLIFIGLDFLILGGVLLHGVDLIPGPGSWDLITIPMLALVLAGVLWSIRENYPPVRKTLSRPPFSQKAP